MMNKSGIDWCDFSWNPVTGCRRGCEYCYARVMARRFTGDARMNKADPQLQITKGVGGDIYTLAAPFKGGRGQAVPFPAGFEPTLHEYRLADPAKKKKPANIFVCSMADLFGPWVPDEWIDRVFEACAAAPWHNYLFLTKYPDRYCDRAMAGKLPQGPGYWYGTSTPTPETGFFWADGYNTFVSVEPIAASFEGSILDKYVADWVIIGAETGQRPGKVQPAREWIEPLVSLCRDKGVPVLLKDSAELRAVWGDDLIQEWPEGLQRAPDAPIPHCTACEDVRGVQQGKRGTAYTCTHGGQDRHILGRYTRTSPPWCPRRKQTE
jgi:protein gp37